MTKTSELEERVKTLELNANKVTKEVAELHDILESESRPSIDIGRSVNRLENIKTEILGYTFQAVTIVVGILALVLTIIFLWLNVENLSNQFFGFFLAIIVFFGGILVLWFILWIRRG